MFFFRAIYGQKNNTTQTVSVELTHIDEQAEESKCKRCFSCWSRITLTILIRTAPLASGVREAYQPDKSPDTCKQHHDKNYGRIYF